MVFIWNKKFLKEKTSIGISLGWNCHTTSMGLIRGLRGLKKDGYKTCPFDLMVSNYEGVIQCLYDDFKDFTNPEYIVMKPDPDYRIDAVVPFNTKYSFSHNHEGTGHMTVYKYDDQNIGEDYYMKNNFEKLIEKLNKRVENFRNYMNSGNHINFLITDFDKNLFELHKCIKTMYPKLNYTITRFDLESRVNETSSAYFNRNMKFWLGVNRLCIKKMKIVLMTKNEKYLIKHWIQYHGEIFGYDSLHIIDDSDDIDVLNYYKSIDHLGITLYRNKDSNLNNLADKITSIMHSLKDSCDFLIKLDTDEFIGRYYVNTNDISIDKSDILDSINSLEINGNKYRVLYSIRSNPTKDLNDPLEYQIFCNPYFEEGYKSFFYSQTFQYCDLGCHNGTLISPYNSSIYNKTNLVIIHYHNQKFEQYIDNCKRSVISHGVIFENDSIENQISKTYNHYMSKGNSWHKSMEYNNYLVDPTFKQKYYKQFEDITPKYKFDKLYKKLYRPKKCIVITTINDPTKQILHYTNISDWDLIIVGDSKTNDELYKNIKCIYLGLEKQKELFPSFYELIPLRSYTRKMFGYLYAIKNNYDIIYDTDDDNEFIGELTIEKSKNTKTSITQGFVNLYKCFTDETIWPRGIPPKHESIDIDPVITDKIPLNCAVIQGLVNNDPDVDAYYRINVNNKSFNFEKCVDYDIALDKGSVCPFNTQNTFWIDSSMFYAMYLPVTVSFRYTDILRGFVALYQLWKNNKTIKFTYPTAIQLRNEHDLAKDYESEVSMYETAEKVIQLLHDNENASIQDMYIILSDHGIVDKIELQILNEWINLIE